MQVKTRTLNDGETFCCSLQKAKELFKNTDTVLNFGYTSRNFGTFVGTPDYYYVKKNIKGKVLASMYSYSVEQTTMLSFYPVSKSKLNENLKQVFEKIYLPKFYDIYINRVPNEKAIKTKVLIVELVENGLKEHKFQF